MFKKLARGLGKLLKVVAVVGIMVAVASAAASILGLRQGCGCGG